jgi:ribosomal protein S18 acetylase RimI-like enzyme
VSQPTPLPALPTENGATWRSPTLDDAASLAAHTRLIHEAETLTFLPNADFFEWLLTQPGMDLADDVRIGEVDGELVADCGTWLHSADTGARCIVWAETTPGFEALRPGMLAWVTARGRARLDAIDVTSKVLRTSIEEHRQALRDDTEAAGYEIARSFADMARPLADLPALSPLPDGVTVIGWPDADDETVRQASNASFADHWGSLPMSTEEWKGFTSESPTFRPDLSFVALDGDEVVSFCLCEVDEDDNAVRDTDDLYIHRVGTLVTHRGQGLASQLMLRSMHAAAATGVLDRAALDVDEMSHTNATLVYQRLGFETYARSLSYVIEVAE